MMFAKRCKSARNAGCGHQTGPSRKVKPRLSQSSYQGEDLFGESPKPRQHGMSAGCRFEVLTDAIEGLFDFDVEGPRQGERIGREK
jgi:hypothetical protein